MPLDAMAAGADVGTFVHRLLERTDFAAADLDGELATHARELLARSPVDVGDPARRPARPEHRDRDAARRRAGGGCAT